MSQLAMSLRGVQRRSKLLTRLGSQRVTVIVALALFIGAFALYARTVAPGLLDGDEGEFQINIYKLGVSHTGYPLFFLLGKLWTMIVPIGAIAYRANLFAAFWGALAVTAVFLSIRLLTSNLWAATFCAILFAASRVEWSQAVIPRPYTLNSLFVVIVTVLFFLWRAGKIDLTIPVFAFGLSLTNHRTMMWFAPAIAILVLWHERGRIFQPRRLLTLAAAFALPLLLYSYVWWRGDSDVGVEFHWKDFNAEIMGGYVSASWRFGPFDWLVSRVTDLYIPLLIEQFTALGFVAGLIGMVALAMNRAPKGFPRDLPARQVFLFLLLTNVANAAFCVVFWVIDIDKFFLPSFITFAFFAGVGIGKIGDWILEIGSRRMRWTTYGGVVALFLAAGGFLIRSNYAANDWSRRMDVAEAWNDNLSQPLEKHALIVGPWESLTPLEYANYVENKRRDLERWKVIVKNYQIGQVPYGSRQEDIEREVRAGRPVYLTLHPSETETLGALADEFRLTRIAELWRVLPLPPTATAPQGKPLGSFSDASGRAIELVGVFVVPSKIRSGDFVLATFFWSTPQSLSARFTISSRLLDSQNRVIVQRDSEPANGMRGTIGWSPNEIVQDDVGLLIPPDAAPGAYRLGVIVYNGATGENMKPDKGDPLQSELFDASQLTVNP